MSQKHIRSCRLMARMTNLGLFGKAYKLLIYSQNKPKLEANNMLFLQLFLAMLPPTHLHFPTKTYKQAHTIIF